jgi:SSS family solute:Na+ symporter
MLIGFLCFGLIYTLVSITWGFSALIALPGLSTPDLATPRLLGSDMVPPILAEIVMIGILAAAISTIDSVLLTLSSMLSRDVYAHAAGHRDEARQVRFGKWALAVIAVLALLFAELRLNLIAVLSVAASTGLAVVVPAIIGAFYWRRGTAAGALASILGGSAVVLILFATGLRPLGLSAGVWVLPVSTALFVGVSLFTRAPEALADEFMAAAAGARR